MTWFEPFGFIKSIPNKKNKKEVFLPPVIIDGGCEETRTLDISGMNRPLYQLSYTAIKIAK